MEGWEVLTLYVAIITEDFICFGDALAVGFSDIPLAFTLLSKVQINLYRLLKRILCIINI